MNIEIVIAALTIIGTILGTILTLRSQDHKEMLAHDVDMARLQEEIRQSLLTELREEVGRERSKRQELEERVKILEMENQTLEKERYKRIELEHRVAALEAENLELRRELTTNN